MSLNFDFSLFFLGCCATQDSPQAGTQIDDYSETVNVTLFGKRVLAYAIKVRILREDHFRLSGWVLIPMTNVLRREREETYRKEDNVKAESKIRVMIHKPKRTMDLQLPPEAGREG